VIDAWLGVCPGDAISQPSGVPHDVAARSDDLEVLESTMPAEYGT